MNVAMGRRERNSVERRARLLAEARKLFDTHGVDATTVEQIAEAAELSGSERRLQLLPNQD